MSMKTNSAKDGFQPPNRDEVWQMLLFIPAYDRKEWIRVGMAIKDYFNDDGYSLWIDWSKDADSYARIHAQDYQANYVGRISSSRSQ